MSATLRFLPWMRRGLARALTAPAPDGVPTSAAGVVTASVTLDGEAIVRDVLLRGPGDVVGLSQAQIVRVDPADGTVDFEPNYFAAVELLAPDLPWMFTPAAPTDDKLVPWLVLVVVAEGHGVRLTDAKLALSAPADASRELPDLRDAWAWAHVQAATEVSDARSVGDAFAAEPEAFLARLVCPRRLDAGTRYLACVVPAFEAGRRAGLGLAVDNADASFAWTSSTTEIELPVYFSWRFATGPDGDFEALIRRLTPRELDAGVHDLDIGDPGSERLPRAPGTLVSFAGPLVSPAVTRRGWSAAHRAAFQPAMRALLGESLTAGSTEPRPYVPMRDDPVVGPPPYGALPIGAEEIPEALAPGARPAPSNRPVWLADVNLDPVARTAAALGAQVVSRNQEVLMASAWTQAASLTEVNRVLNWTRLASEVGAVVAAKKLAPLDDGALIQLAGTARARIAGGAGVTVRGLLASASAPSGVTSAAFRRAARPGGPVGRGLGAASARSATAAKVATTFTNELAAAMSFAAFVRPLGVQIGDQSVIAGLPGTTTEPSSSRRRARTGVPVVNTAITRDVISLSLPVAATSLSTAGVAAKLRAGLAPAATLAAKLRARITAPASAWGDTPVPAAMWISPAFPDPLCELLRRIDPDLMLPGAGAIPDDSVGLVAVNAAFVEAFLLGANYELARELAWREYPADLRGTYLRTFWDAGTTADIDAVDAWSPGRLGTHQIGAGADATLALVIKGALLRRYPDTVIYAVKARWTADGTAREELPGGERRAPIFSGSLGRGLVYLGFALTEDEALGTVDADGAPMPTGDAGWFFVFEEPPIGPRFGLDVGDARDAGAAPHRWKNVSWGHQVEEFALLEGLTHARADGRLASIRRQYDDGTFTETWGKSAAAMARITFQRPVRMLVHASAMLP